VVGVDGSLSSKAALGRAVRQAKLTGAVVEAVIAWHHPASYGYPVTVPDDADQHCVHHATCPVVIIRNSNL
jgi:hypothetical protein